MTLSPSQESRAIDGSGSRSGAATGSRLIGSRTETVDGSSPAGASQSLVTSSPPSRTTKELWGRGTGSRWEASTSSPGSRRCAQRPSTMCRSPHAWAARPPGHHEPAGRRGELATVWSELGSRRSTQPSTAADWGPPYGMS